jgi:hypothetical protein
MNDINLKLTKRGSEEIFVLAMSLLLAWLLAAHQGTQFQGYNVFSTYLYWTCRILIELAMFITVFIALEKYLTKYLSVWLRFGLAILCSLIPFTLIITAFDLIIGLPELGLNGPSYISTSRVREFGFELLFLLDNHILFCLLIFLPRLLTLLSGHTNVKELLYEATKISEQVEVKDTHYPDTFFDTLEPRLTGSLCCMEAQEHYIQVISSEESRMVLHRFSDAVRLMPMFLGMQVHRSHWVAHSAVQEVIVDGQSMKLKLSCGKSVPVSRTFRATVEKKYVT